VRLKLEREAVREHTGQKRVCLSLLSSSTMTYDTKHI